MSERDLRLWIYASPFVGLALYLASIHPHEAGWIYANNLDAFVFIFLFVVPVLLPIRRFQILPFGFVFFIASTFAWQPIVLAASDHISIGESIRLSFRGGKFIQLFGDALIQLTIPFILIVIKILFREWLYSRYEESISKG
ncbi:MAG: hypothetical protein KF836_12100 [Fimbriimonadaceae bacterium]|nr:hypothetical protein [Fimbriimonadaceae bacterium]